MRTSRILASIFIVLAIIALFVVGMIFWNRWSNDQFLRSMQGEVVFSHRDGENLNIYVIKANGQDRKLLFQNEEQTPFPGSDQINQNSDFPHWSEDGTKIRFTAARGRTPGDASTGGWKLMETNADGSDVRIVSGAPPDAMLSRNSRSPDLSVDGDVYYRDERGEEHLVYDVNDLLISDIFRGASEASWSPDKKYVIFELCIPLKPCAIYIANKEGTRAAKLTEGQNPDWMY